ncbi:acyl-CoA dehydrogenase family protein [Stutzerimonas stutzeri]|uniref:acyl-CoA dehydrogenase family protein n=1 Tax=Stutzerimonas stutzeri TaxID=316 RepID=UPI002108D6B7|nr:acyl-CoA dehydrogenase family protein [Stutzerimonas stutzeri]MCQ4322245.1 acyl-CoA dehydrogenase family protein [Stutzerimonas stutzeri]
MQRLVLNEEQQMLKDAAKGFLQENAPVAQLRQLRDSRDATGFSLALWQQSVEMGFVGTLVPEAFGGTDFGHVGMGQILEEAGRNLSASPLFATGVLGVCALRMAGNEAQQQRYLPAIAAGRLLTALAVDEAGRHAPRHVRTRAERSGDGFVISGRKTYVIDAHVADTLIVAARTAGEAGDADGITLLLVDREAPGVEVERTLMVDSRNAGVVRFDQVRVGAEAVLGEVGQGSATLERLLDVGNAHLAAELLGIAQEAFERTVAYLKERKQFGVTLGSFQALQHRAAHLWSEIELLKSVVLKALKALDDGDADTAMRVSVAKAKACEVAELATNEGVQLHGGVGMTDEYDIGLFLKRARPVQQLFGDYRYHVERFAALNGY